MKTIICVGVVLAMGAGAGVSLAAEHHGHTMHIPSYVRAAVDSTTRPESDRMRDVNRKPAEVLTFAGVKPGMKVGELMPARGYYTRLLCRIVGADGHVYTVNFKMNMPPGMARREMPKPEPLGCDNVTPSTQSAGSLMLPSDLDMVWTSENYHDFHNPMMGSPDMRQFDQAIYDSLKPGGVFIVEDHAAAAGSGTSATNTLHRIDPEQVKKEVESVGFKLVGSSNVLHNASDTHEQPVFKMVDKTDRFLFKFEKPKS